MTARAPEPDDPAVWRRRLRRGSLLVLALSVATLATMIALGGGLRAVASAVAAVPTWALLGALACVALEWGFDVARFAVAGRVFGFRASFGDWLRIALAHLSAAYAANVGAPVGAWLLARRGMAPGEALALVVGKQLLFFPIALAPAWAIATFAPASVPSGPVRVTLQTMGVVGVVIVIGLLVLARAPGRVRRVIDRAVIRIAGDRGAGFVDEFLAGLRRFYVERPRLLAASIALALANQAAILATVVVLLRGFGAPIASARTLGGSTLFATLSQIAPTPGGAGISEVGGALVFQAVLASSALVGFLVIARFLTVQLPILLGGWLLARELREGANV